MASADDDLDLPRFQGASTAPKLDESQSPSRADLSMNISPSFQARVLQRVPETTF
jgi:hypothetical protein